MIKVYIQYIQLLYFYLEIDRMSNCLVPEDQQLRAEIHHASENNDPIAPFFQSFAFQGFIIQRIPRFNFSLICYLKFIKIMPDGTMSATDGIGKEQKNIFKRFRSRRIILPHDGYGLLKIKYSVQQIKVQMLAFC